MKSAAAQRKKSGRRSRMVKCYCLKAILDAVVVRTLWCEGLERVGGWGGSVCNPLLLQELFQKEQDNLGTEETITDLLCE